MEPITAGFKHVLTYFKLAGEKPGDPCLARIYYCLRSAGDKASASTLLYKPYTERFDANQEICAQNLQRVGGFMF